MTCIETPSRSATRIFLVILVPTTMVCTMVPFLNFDFVDQNQTLRQQLFSFLSVFGTHGSNGSHWNVFLAHCHSFFRYCGTKRACFQVPRRLFTFSKFQNGFNCHSYTLFLVFLVSWLSGSQMSGIEMPSSPASWSIWPLWTRVLNSLKYIMFCTSSLSFI